ncbi:winged helix-turn-helix domain-containing protein, partial [Cupriavidus plantarum]
MGKLDRTQGELGRQLTRVLREAIRSGELKPGESLPSTRHLAETVGISRGLVTNAFEQLIAEGFLEAQAGSSTRVSRSLSALLSTLPPSETAGQPRKTSRTNRTSATIPAPTLPPRAAAFADVAR